MRTFAVLVLLTFCACGPPEGDRRLIEDKWEDGSIKCEGREIYTNGEWLKDGGITIYHRGGKLAARGSYDRGLESGPWEEWHEDETHGVGNYVDGLRDGWWSYFHASGEKQEEGRYTAGMREGEWLWWYSDGRLRSNALYAGGKRNGPTTDYRLDGTVDEVTSGQYVNGELVDE